MIGGLSYDDSEPSVIPTQRDVQRGPPPLPNRNVRHHRSRESRHRFPRNNMNRNMYFGNLASADSSTIFSSELQGLSGLVHDGSTDQVESSSSFVIAATPDNVQRSASASLEAPRMDRQRQRNQR